jgi:hypothetical protein
MATSTKPTFYTVFSNSIKPDEYLPNLSEEATKISDLLHGLVFSDAIYYMKDEIFTADRLIANFSKYGDKFDIFYFSGHAKDGALKFSDNFISNTDRMADVININLKNLQLGFFNACETFDLAKKIIEKRLKTNSSNHLVMITCGCAINAFLAEKFATLFFNHVGRPGTYYDAYKNASTLLSLVNDKLRFREFYDPAELANATSDFDYAFIDIPVTTRSISPASAASPDAAGSFSSPGNSAFAGSATAMRPLPAGSTTAAGRISSPAPAAPPAMSPAGPTTGAVPSKTDAAKYDDGAIDSDHEAGNRDGSHHQQNIDLENSSDVTGTGVPPDVRALPDANHSIISPDKKTMDILSANFIKECTQTVLDSNALGHRQKAILNEAIRGTREVVDGSLVSGKVKQLWKEAARILPGVDSKSDFKSLIKVSRGSYDKALDDFFGKASRQPKVVNIAAPVEPVK